MKNLLGIMSLAVPYVIVTNFLPHEGMMLAFPVAAAIGIAAVAGSALAAGGGEAAPKVSGKKIVRQAGKFLPAIRKLEATGAIPGFQQAAATQTARRGLTGTGLGAAINIAGGGAGELFALRKALEMASGIQSQNAALQAAAPPQQSTTSNLLGALGQGLLSLPGGGQQQGALPQSTGPGAAKIGETFPGTRSF